MALTDVKTGSKLRGVAVNHQGDTLDVENRAAIWTAQMASNGMWWKTENGYLAPVEGKTDLRISSSPYVWQTTVRRDTLLLSFAYNGQQRVVGYDQLRRYFGCYAESGFDEYGGLLLFRAVSDATADTTKSTTEEVLDTALNYALVARHGEEIIAASARMTTDFKLKSSRFNDNLAADSTFLADDDDLCWHFALRTDGGYDLINNDGNGLFPYPYGTHEFGFELRRGSQSDARWVLRDGHLAMVDADNRLLHLVYNPSDVGYFSLVELVSPEMSVVSPAALAAQGSVLSPRAGELSLYGYFSAAGLQNMMTDTVLSLDLTHAVLPLRARLFDESKQGNALIYVSASMAPYVPLGWRNVVVCDSQQVGRVLRPVRLKDGEPFAVSRPFSVGPDSLTYTRSLAADGNWATLYLPFSVSVWPRGVQPYRYVGIENNQLNLESMGAYRAYTPILLKREADATLPDTVCFVAEPQRVGVTAETQTEFCGTLVRYSIPTDVTCYLLADDGQRFVRAADGSYAAPFRCYLKTEKAARALLLDFNQTAILSTKSKAAPQAIYSLDGMRLPAKPRHGFYIEGKAVHWAE